MITQVLYDGVRDGLTPATVYLELVLSHISSEPNAKLVETILRRANGVLNSYLPEKMQPTW